VSTRCGRAGVLAFAPCADALVKLSAIPTKPDRISGSGSEDKTFHDLPVFRPDIDDLSFDVGTVQEPHLNCMKQRSLWMRITVVGVGPQGEWIGGRFHGH
jgi:hypothetical protein